jgi:hypothetical protein
VSALAPLSELSNSGAVAVLSKPVDLDRLEQALFDAVHPPSSWPETAAVA